MRRRRDIGRRHDARDEDPAGAVRRLDAADHETSLTWLLGGDGRMEREGKLRGEPGGQGDGPAGIGAGRHAGGGGPVRRRSPIVPRSHARLPPESRAHDVRSIVSSVQGALLVGNTERSISNPAQPAGSPAATLLYSTALP